MPATLPAMLARLLAAPAPLTLTELARGAQPLVLADIARAAYAEGRRAVFIAPDEAAMQALAEVAATFAPELAVITFPAWDCLPYDRVSPMLGVSARRLAALHRLQAPIRAPQVLITTINAALQRVLTPFRIRESVRELGPGMAMGRDSLIALLLRQGYARTDTVADAGEFAVRGGLIDIFPASATNEGATGDGGTGDGATNEGAHGEGEPLRLDFLGDTLETLRHFDPTSQRSTGAAAPHLLLPASEVLLDAATIARFRGGYRERFGAAATSDPLYRAVSEGRRMSGIEHWLPLFEERLVTLFDHLAPGDVLLIDAAARAAADERLADIADYHAARMEGEDRAAGAYRPLAPEALYLTRAALDATLATWPAHRAEPFAAPPGEDVLAMGFASGRDFTPERGRGENIYAVAARHLGDVARAKRRAILACYSPGSLARITGLIAEATSEAPGLAPPVAAASWAEALALAGTGRAAALVLPLAHGFASADIDLITEQDLLGDRLVRRRKRRKSADAFLAELAALAEGDLVVHRDHGIGRYEGLQSVPVDGSPHDCVRLGYAGGDKLYVPVENLDVLTRYGGDHDGITLDRLGGEAWQRRRAKLKERIRDIAHALLRTAAARALKTAPVLLPDPAAYAAFVDRFPWAETEDQEAAIHDVLGDLGSGQPMDRLVCGDVGFGKTEVALRAAFVAAMAGCQVALIAPTTLLARQHYEGFCARFSGFPLTIGRLSRLVSAHEAKETRAALANGRLDIIIGTHALLAKGVSFDRLGLVIVDEEQHFGVTHKERLKQLREDVHVLTLTATPIPRTLQMAMSGLRELSTIRTPPVDRLAVRSYVMAWDGVVLREALLREHHRGGQSFIIVPRIADMADVEAWLREAVPEISHVAAHGQMAPSEVEARMSAFYERRYDVLLATSIVESGLDIPSANTIIIHRADRFGLAQLYQLRGRVGRAKLRAYAYLTTPAGQVLSTVAEKRLKILSDLDSLGAGFQLASHDLDLRGAGNILGDEQSGHIREVGFELYQAMLEDAILAAKAGAFGLEREAQRFSPQITVAAPIMIPEDYVPDLAVRMALYRRLNDAADTAEIEALSAEMIDRFGPLPAATANLVKLIIIKSQAITAHIARIDVGPRGTLVAFHNDHFPDPAGLIAYATRLAGTVKLRPDSKLAVTRVWGDPEARLNGLMQLTKGLAAIAQRTPG